MSICEGVREDFWMGEGVKSDLYVQLSKLRNPKTPRKLLYLGK